MARPYDKDFGIGMYKTGTRSLAAALRTLGFSTYSRYDPYVPELAAGFDLSTDRFRPFYPAIHARLAHDESFVDSPWIYLYRELDEWYPGSRFILTLRRDAEAVADSELRMWARNGLDHLWRQETGSEPTAEIYIERYERPNSAVHDYFRDRPRDLLAICFETEEDPWGRLCRFLEIALVPQLPFPWENRDPRREGEDQRRGG